MELLQLSGLRVLLLLDALDELPDSGKATQCARVLL